MSDDYWLSRVMDANAESQQRQYERQDRRFSNAPVRKLPIRNLIYGVSSSLPAYITSHVAQHPTGISGGGGGFGGGWWKNPGMCPPGFHKAEATGMCVPDSVMYGTDQPSPRVSFVGGILAGTAIGCFLGFFVRGVLQDREDRKVRLEKMARLGKRR